MIKSVLQMFALLLVLAGCTHLQDFLFPEPLDKDANTVWKKNLKMKINGYVYRGIANVPRADKYEIKIYPSFKEIDRLQWRTCNGGDFADEAVEHSVWPWKKDDKYFKMSFSLMPIEKERACVLNYEALEDKHRTMDFAMVVFPPVQNQYQLETTIECNRKVRVAKGHWACQAPSRAVTRVRFHGREKIFQSLKENSKCPPMDEIAEGIFELHMPKDLCVYEFQSLKKDTFGNRLRFRFYTFGFEDFPPPKGV